MRRRSRRGGRLQSRIYPARMDPSIKAVGGFGIDHVGMQNKAPERHLDMAAWAAEAVIELKVAKGGVQIVAPKQADDAPPKPDAFRIAGWAAYGALRFSKLVDFMGLLRAVFGGVLGALLGGVSGAVFRRRGLLVSRLGVVVLRESGRTSAAGCGRQEP